MQENEYTIRKTCKIQVRHLKGVNEQLLKVFGYFLASRRPMLTTVFLILGNKASDVQEKRVAAAIGGSSNETDLFLMSGGNGEAEAMADIAVAKGIARDRILLETESQNTIENLLFSKLVLQNSVRMYNLVICTSTFHLTRSLILAKFVYNATVTGIHTNEPVPVPILEREIVSLQGSVQFLLKQLFASQFRFTSVINVIIGSTDLAECQRQVAHVHAATSKDNIVIIGPNSDWIADQFCPNKSMSKQSLDHFPGNVLYKTNKELSYDLVQKLVTKLERKYKIDLPRLMIFADPKVMIRALIHFRFYYTGQLSYNYSSGLELSRDQALLLY